MPNLFNYWGIQRNEDARVAEWQRARRENTEDEETRRRSREYLKKLVIRNQGSDLSAATLGMINRLDTLIANNHLPLIDKVAEHLQNKILPENRNQAYGNNDNRLKGMATFFEPTVVARRGIRALSQIDDFFINNLLGVNGQNIARFINRNDFMESDIDAYNLALITYMAEANNPATYRKSYNAGDITRNVNIQEVQGQADLLFASILADEENGHIDYKKLCDYGTKLLKLGKFGEAIEYFERALNVNQYCEEAYSGKGMAYAELANVNKIQEEIQNIMEVLRDLQNALAALRNELANMPRVREIYLRNARARYVAQNINADLIEQNLLQQSAVYDERNAIKIQNKQQDIAVIQDNIAEVNQNIAASQQQLQLIPEYERLSRESFIQSHLELKKTAFVKALYEGTRGSNFNVDEDNTFAHENFRGDSHVCNNGHVNKFAECFAIFEGEPIATHTTQDLYKAVITQVFKSYQRVHMQNGQVRAGAPTLMNYAQALQHHHANPNGNDLISREFRTIWDNIFRIFHGVNSAANPQGLLKLHEVTLLDAAAQTIEDLIGVYGNDCEELRTEEDLRKFNVIAAREDRFEQNEVEINAAREIANILSRYKNEVIANVQVLDLNSGPAFNVPVDLNNAWQHNFIPHPMRIGQGHDDERHAEEDRLFAHVRQVALGEREPRGLGGNLLANLPAPARPLNINNAFEFAAAIGNNQQPRDINIHVPAGFRGEMANLENLMLQGMNELMGDGLLAGGRVALENAAQAEAARIADARRVAENMRRAQDEARRLEEARRAAEARQIQEQREVFARQAAAQQVGQGFNQAQQPAQQLHNNVRNSRFNL